jgi:hypothetical protein
MGPENPRVFQIPPNTPNPGRRKRVLEGYQAGTHGTWTGTSIWVSSSIYLDVDTRTILMVTWTWKKKPPANFKITAYSHYSMNALG